MAGDNSPAMKNKYIRLFVALTKLMTAEKMRLDRFCQPGEHLAYAISIPNSDDIAVLSRVQKDDIPFSFECFLETQSYRFQHDNIDTRTFRKFEQHMSEYLNLLWERKVAFEKRAEDLDNIHKMFEDYLTDEQRKTLATHIDANPTAILRMLGVVDSRP